jgi:acyl-CoA synthetase (AMP-forming)/AMP-acid ligase II
MNLGDIPRRNARRFARREAFAGFTWAEVDARVNRLANALDVAPGERVAILAHNDHRYLETYWALAKRGAIAVPLNFRLLEDERAALLAHAEVCGIVLGPEYADAPAPGWRLCFGDEYESALLGASAEPPGEGPGADDPFAIMYTSGTTGLPKGAVVTHGNLESNVYNQAIADKADPDDVNLTVTPLYHMGALFMATTYTALGCSNPILERFEPAAALAAIERERATTCLLVPTMLRMVLDEPSFAARDLSSLRLVFYGGGPMPLAVLRRAIDAIGCGFTQGYGLTETIEATFLVAGDHALDGEPARERRLASAGREAVNAEVRVVDPLGDDLPPGEIGEILIRGPSVIREYWRAPELTAQTIRDGWFHTGDAGYRDEDGYLFVVDRLKDVIISGGENVYPKDVEEVLYAHPAVAEVAVIGTPDETWGEVVTAVVVAREPVEPDALLEHCRARLAGYKRPRAVRFMDALPRNPSGKILKRELRA